MASAYDRIRGMLNAGSWVVLGGPMGAELVRRGVRWRGHGMLTDGPAVQRLYADYLAAGADVIRTNTFQLNRRIYLDVFRDANHMAHIGAPGLAKRHRDLTRRAVELARAARDSAGRSEAAIAGVLAPLEHAFRPDLAPLPEIAAQEHAELAGILKDAGADLLILESMNTLPEARVAAAAAARTGLPFWVSFTLGPDGLLLGGDLPAGAARAMRDQGAEAVLVAGVPPADVARGLGGFGTDGTLGAAPFVGRYDPPSWKFEFFPRFCDLEIATPSIVADRVPEWRGAGARIIGTDGGAGPEHTAALVAARGRGA
ncbi:MAG: homocysteine S-methyltransferase family protein [Chloroflexota bacterium]